MKAGTAYLESGQEVEVMAEVGQGHVIRYLYGGDGDEGPNCGEPVYYGGKLFGGIEDVIERHEPKFRALRDEEQKLRQDIAKLRAEQAQTVKDRTDLIHKLEQVKALRGIEDFIEGRITHVVEISCYKGPCIREFKEYKVKDGCDCRELFRLITLFGRSNGDLLWNINRYSDGSGSGGTVYLCKSYEEALLRVRECLEDERGGIKKWSVDLVQKYLRWGLPVADAAKNEALSWARAERFEALKKAEVALKNAQAAFDAVSMQLFEPEKLKDDEKEVPF